MSAKIQTPYSGITHEELHVIVRRAHAERAQAMRRFFAALIAWRKRADRQPQATTLRTVGSH